MIDVIRKCNPFSEMTEQKSGMEAEAERKEMNQETGRRQLDLRAGEIPVPPGAGVKHGPTGTTDPQTGEAGTKGGNSEPDRERRRAQLSMGRKTNSCLNRRH